MAITDNPLTVADLIARLQTMPADAAIVHVGDAHELDEATGDWAVIGTQTSVLSSVQFRGDDIALVFNGHGTSVERYSHADIITLPV